MKRWTALGALLALALGFGSCGGASGDDVVIFAAASLRDVLQDLRPVLRQATGREPVYNFAGSNVLAQQIEAAPVADVFLSAHERWVDFLEESGRLVPGTRRVFTSNRLVVVTHRDSELVIREPRDLASPAVRFVSLGDPSAVPAGVYAKAFLEQVELPGGGTLWEAVRDRVAPAPDVRAALGMVEARPDVVGIVYRTDAMQSADVEVRFAVPPGSAPPILYVAAAVQGGPAGPQVAGKVLETLGSPGAKEILEGHGFAVEIPEAPP